LGNSRFLDASVVDEGTEPKEDIEGKEDKPDAEENKAKFIPALFAAVFTFAVAIVFDDLASKPPSVGSIHRSYVG